MVPDAYVNHIPALTRGYGPRSLLVFNSFDFIPAMPPDTKIVPVSRTVGEDQLVDEMIFSFTHSQPIPWMLPGVAPTHLPVRVPLVAIKRDSDFGSWLYEQIFTGIRHGAQANRIVDRPLASGSTGAETPTGRQSSERSADSRYRPARSTIEEPCATLEQGSTPEKRSSICNTCS